jgi:hypothetical protein
MGSHKGGQTHQGLVNTKNCDTSKQGVLGAILEYGKAKFTKNFIVYTLDGIEAILRNTFLHVYCVDILRKSFKLRVSAN